VINDKTQKLLIKVRDKTHREKHYTAIKQGIPTPENISNTLHIHA
jgi:hypothetical protein